MKEIIERGDVEEVYDDGTQGERWYIPHHGVYHPRKPTKLQVVFDCSVKYSGTSLNEHLFTGPDLINNLTGILLRFRQHSIALMCDIEKMFHQFHVQEADRNYLRFLWWRDGDTSTQPQEYRMKVHLFGAASSPGCANYGLKYLVKGKQSFTSCRIPVYCKGLLCGRWSHKYRCCGESNSVGRRGEKDMQQRWSPSSQICLKQPCCSTKHPFIRMCDGHQVKGPDIQ